VKREKIAAVILVGLVIFISFWMLVRWDAVKETTLLRGAIPSVEKK